jgi:hypothetical protein
MRNPLHKRIARPLDGETQAERSHEVDTMIITRRDLQPILTLVDDYCPAGCDLASAVLCWLHHERQLRADLAAAVAAGSPDAEVVRADLRAVELRIDALIARGREAA